MKNFLQLIPSGTLLPYQWTWLRDSARFKIGLWARQTGKDFTAMCEAAWNCALTPNSTWIIMATGERQARETLAKGRHWAQVASSALEASSAKTPTFDVSATQITWSNGSRLIAIPARAETARGYSGNIILTEFAFHDDSDKIWRAIYPTISNPLAGSPKKLRIISTPNGCSNKFHQLWHEAGNYSKHRVTIHDAISQGLQLNLDELRSGLNDDDGWQQEYECNFRDSSTVLLPYELIQPCEDPEATTDKLILSPVGTIAVGIDFGRQRDRTVCWTIETIGDLHWTREVVVLDKTTTPDQLEVLRPRLRHARLVCIDYTGPGVGLGDLLVREFGQWKKAKPSAGKIDLCHFTRELKNELFPRLRTAFERKILRIPINEEIREDLHAVQRVVSNTGEISYRAPHTPDGHSDRCTALALAMRAVANQPPKFDYEIVRYRPRLRGAW